ncbi:hypothetical protein [Planotetraspora sp. GP83]|uniref:hypothetical protein n=1 Tax=Planotetraspora sp. GP83 TaxID=3156264 RepID=UPI0035146820
MTEPSPEPVPEAVDADRTAAASGPAGTAGTAGTARAKARPCHGEDRGETDVTKPWTSDRDPVRRRRWYTDEEFAAVQVVKSGDVDGSYWVIVAGELLGTVQPHLSARGTRSGWEARRRGGSLAWHLGTGAGGGKRPATRDKAVTDLIYDVKHAWDNQRRQRRRA